MLSKGLRLTPLAFACCVLCHAAARADDTTLPTVTVTAQADKARSVESNRLGVSLAETAQAATVITAELIQAQEARNLDQVLSNVPGVVSGAGSQAFQNFFMRGFMVDNVSNYLRDGLRFDRQHEVSLQNIEQVEVVRGPGSLQYGKLAPGGLINMVTKKPKTASHTRVSAFANDVGQLEATLDTTGAIGDGGAVLYRFNAEAKRIDSFRDHVKGDAYLIAPALTFILSDKTTLDVNFEQTRIDVVPDSGQPAPDGASIASITRLHPRTFYGETDANWYSRSQLLAAHLKHDLNERWQLRADALTGKLERAIYQIDSWGLEGNAVTRTSLPYFLDQTSSTVRLELGGRLQTGAVKHNLLAGVDHLSRIVRNQDGQRIAIAPVDLLNPRLQGNTPFDLRLDADSADARAKGLYLQDQLEWGPWLLMAGLRHDRLEDSRATISQKNSRTSPSGALMYRVGAGLSLYASYSESFESNVGRNFAGGVFDPALGKQVELGAKGNITPDLQWSAALYDLRKTNMTTRDLAHTGFSVQTGEQRSKGVELEMSGRIGSALRVHGALSFLDAKIHSDNTLRVGNELRNAPGRTARVWGEYAFAGAWQHLSASLGTTYVSERFADLRNNYRVPSSVVWDAGARYAIGKRDSVQLSLRNLANRRYVEDAQDLDLITPGSPRTVSLRYTHSF